MNFVFFQFILFLRILKNIEDEIFLKEIYGNEMHGLLKWENENLSKTGVRK